MSANDYLGKEQVATTIKQYITEAFLYDRAGFSLTNDFPLITQGVIDSMGIFRLITYLEGEFGITLDPVEIEFDNFATIDAIATLITRNAAA